MTNTDKNDFNATIGNTVLSDALYIQEGNLLISEFLEDEINANRTEVYPKKSYGCNGVYSVENLRYHYSWDWLMPVVKEIKELKIEEFSKKKPIMSALMDVDIDILWTSVVAFLKWYEVSERQQITEEYFCCGDN